MVMCYVKGFLESLNAFKTKTLSERKKGKCKVTGGTVRHSRQKVVKYSNKSCNLFD